MKRISIIGKFTALALVAILSLCGCNEQIVDSSNNATSDTSGTGTIESNETTVSEDISSTVTQDDSIWFSEQAGVRGRIWLGMSEKEVYDVLKKYNIEINTSNSTLEYDSYGATTFTGTNFFKQLEAVGHQFYEFDKNDQLMEFTYQGQIHFDEAPIDESFFSEKGLKRGDSYDQMLKLYGQPDKTTKITNEISCVFKLENENYLIFTFDGDSSPLFSITYSIKDTTLFD